MITTEAWLLDRGPKQGTEPGELRRGSFSFPDITPHEILAEPLYGCWEANMTHALKRFPVDVCRLRCEEQVVLGNSGIVRVLETGGEVSTVEPGDICMLAPFGELDGYGYMMRVFGYDAPNTIGLLARKIKLQEKQVVPIPKDTRHDLRRWAGASVRYATARDNWGVAYGCFRLQVSEDEDPTPFVWSWGGGVGLGELILAKRQGCRVAMISSMDERLRLIEENGITPIDRREFPNLQFDAERFESDREYRRTYLDSERRFLVTVRSKTEGRRVSIFIDNIGGPVLRPTLKALARQGVLTTAGWDRGSQLTFDRITECTRRHIHVHTHGARYAGARATVTYAEETDWLPPVEEEVWDWDHIPELARSFAAGEITTYFPIFRVNDV